ncbi:charged multivesicular body protein 4 [Malassezia restricta]|uniref:charged multivesicular body protein 4 n=1 Tax=Malassezia restricta TaxID=76775 RepID=UPI000DD13D46|nr:charged multivesicular body protein 4 [Malassezia restricta]AXA51668.1 charged multivesicular body protein 4 [Malassezia restricta]
MAGWFSWISGRRDNKNSARDAIIGLREQLHLMAKKEEHLLTKIDDELRKAKEHVTNNKRAAQAALRQKKMYETELDRLAGSRMTLETQVNAIENANMNLETMRAMQRGSAALKSIHANMDIDRVDNTMDSIREEMALSNEISEAISNPVGMGHELDEEELRNELQELEQDELQHQLVGAESAPAHHLATSSAAPRTSNHADTLDEDAELRALQAELAM